MQGFLFKKLDPSVPATILRFHIFVSRINKFEKLSGRLGEKVTVSVNKTFPDAITSQCLVM